MTADHYLPLFVGDFFGATGTWTCAEAGTYVLLLMHEWASGPLPAEPKRLALTLRMPESEFAKVWPTIETKFRLVDGKLINSRLESIRVRNAEIQASRSRAAGVAAKARWATPSSSSQVPNASATDSDTHSATDASGISDAMPQNAIRSVSVSEPSKKEKEETRHRARPVPEIDLATIPGLDLEAWRQWSDYRRAINKPLKAASVRTAAEELSKFGPEQAAVVRQSIAHSWQGLFALKHAPANGNSQSQTPSVSRTLQERIRIAARDFPLAISYREAQIAASVGCTVAEVHSALQQSNGASPERSAPQRPITPATIPPSAGNP